MKITIDLDEETLERLKELTPWLMSRPEQDTSRRCPFQMAFWTALFKGIETLEREKSMDEVSSKKVLLN